MSSSLLSIETPFLSTISENPESRIVKGFCSTERVDYSGHRAISTEFQMDIFKNSPIILLNHEFITEPNGVKSAAGLIKVATASYIKSENPENFAEWLVYSVKSDEFVATFPKDKVPKLGRGDRGLFVVGEVFHPTAVQKIDSGEVGGFSWRGQAILKQMPDGIGDLTQIELQEITITQLGDNNHSTFVLTEENDPSYNKEIAIKSCVPYKLKFDKEDYDSETVTQYIKKYHPNKQISETENDYFVQLAETSDVVSDSAFVFTKYLIAAPMKEKKNIVTKFKPDPQENIMSQDQKVASTEPRQSVAVKYSMVNVDALKMLVPGLEVQENVDTFEVVKGEATLEASVDVLTIPQEAVDQAIEAAIAVETEPVVEAEATPEVEKSAEVVEEVKTEVEEASQIESRVDRLEQGILALMEGVNNTNQMLQEKQLKEAAALEAVKQAKIEAEKAEAAKSAAKWEQQLKMLTNSAVPAQPVREERIDSTKSLQAPTPHQAQLSKEILADAAVAWAFNKNVNMQGAY